MTDMKKILVTGKNGSLSTAVADYIRNKNEYAAEQISVRGDAWKARSFSGIAAVVHIAGVTPQNAKSAEDYYRVNADLTGALAEKCRADGVPQFIYISSMAVYGIEQSMDAAKGTVTKDTVPHPVTDYGKSKLMAEEAVRSLTDERFRAAFIRVPSIYGKGKTEYMDQYKYLAEKLPVIPEAFTGLYKSVICVDNLCELIYLTAATRAQGVLCPDDGQLSAVDFCSAIYPNKRKSKAAGKLMALFLKNNSRILDYYGAVCYDKALSDCFAGKYRVRNWKEAVGFCYET